MNGFFALLLDLVLIGLLITGIVYALRLSRQLKNLRASRTEMERFVLDFSATVHRAESGVRGLKQAARTSGDDLEKLIEKAQSLRDELHFLVESADQIATRLSDTAATATRAFASEPEKSAPLSAAAKPRIASVPTPESSKTAAASDKKGGASSAAERELMRALEKLG
ncbi:MAG: hypothetical protein HGA90_01135 [Alphaproteobacteria bacterium]|nr:hypothetical protein [Alphaproteobacteria bacterium]